MSECSSSPDIPSKANSQDCSSRLGGADGPNVLGLFDEPTPPSQVKQHIRRFV